MKVFTEIEELIGKKSFHDNRLEKLKGRFNPPKTSFLSIEFTNENRAACRCIVTTKEKVLDLIVEDIERAEGILEKVENKEIVKRVLEILNKEKPLCSALEEQELALIKEYSFVTAKAIVIFSGQDLNSLLQEIFKSTKSISFFTVNKNEARAWLIKSGTDVVSAAAKIHRDLARGFIRAEVYNIKELDNFKNLDDAKQRGILKIVDKDYIVEDGDVINIKFKI